MKLSDIEASLNNGRFFTRGFLKFFYFALIPALLLPLLLIGIAIAAIVAKAEWDSEMITIIIFGNIFGLGLLTVVILILNANAKLKKKISLCLKDENIVKTTAYSKKIGEIINVMQPKSVKIQVDFEIHGFKYTRISAGRMLGTFFRFEEGHHKIFTKYADRKINILYSPKYDEVLILKNTTAN